MEPLDMDRFPHRGEFDVEGCALAGRGANINFSSVLFDDAITDRKPQAGAAPAGFGGEKWIENPMDVLAWNTRASVDDFDFHAAVMRGSAHFQHSAAGHGVARVQEQIQKYLLELVCGPTHCGKRNPQLLDHLNL